MKSNPRYLYVLMVTVLISFAACKKETATSTDTTDSASSELTMHADEQSSISVGTDAVTNESILAAEGTASISGNALSVVPEMCDATITYDTSGSIRKITFTYTGSNCKGAFTRTGSVILSMAAGVYWKNAGAVLTITYENLKITRTSDNKSFTINGSHSITNVSGGLLMNLASLSTITHTIASSGMTITFDDNTQRNWQIAEKRVFTYNNGVVITITGEHTDGSNNTIAIWGINRLGHAFTTSITQPLVLKQDCNFRITSGQFTHAGFATATATYGLDASGEPTSCPGTSSYYCKVSWTGPAGHSYNAMFPY